MRGWARNRDRSEMGERYCSVWTPFGIGMMVLGYIVFWPLGLVLTLWMVSGRHVADLPRSIGQTVSGWFPRRDGDGGWSGHAGKADGFSGFSRSSGSGNSVFDDYQQTQYDRISEIKQEIKDTWRRFREFRSDEQRRQERDEFDRFMRGGGSEPGSGSANNPQNSNS